ncbi:MAG: NAD-dependent epimerase/dehydratase family protein [Candidatus Marsarchaeota archaeon]|nr:NAD-dependent epimerase/dehydratase family protein [Candidatus Marsarchaeota archaeon]
MLVVVAGASGRLGGRLCALLRARKIPMLALVRTKEAAASLPAGVRAKLADYSDPSSLSRALAGATHVVNCTGSVDEEGGEAALYDANVLTTSRLLSACPPKLARFVHISSISVYGDYPPMPANEFSPHKPNGAYGRTKNAGEMEALEWAQRLPVVVLQPGMIYGPGFKTGFWPMLKAIKAGRATIIGDGGNVLPLVHVDDVAGGILRALRADVPSGSAFLLVNDERITQKQALEGAAKALGASPPAASMGAGAAYGLAWSHSLLSRLRGKASSLTPSMMLQLSTNRVFDVYRARRFLGWKPAISFKEGLAQVIKQFKASS